MRGQICHILKDKEGSRKRMVYRYTRTKPKTKQVRLLGCNRGPVRGGMHVPHLNFKPCYVAISECRNVPVIILSTARCGKFEMKK